ncbi:ATP-dependent endonuclease [Erysipelothrix rhusiopathiae]|nr:ATP-dependent endonuclease [Erysipelothrix rhusiopathiae]MDE8080794.1 ATP-dependent endonuclease [Erysipelothrix rhusiopathiae]MDE8084941.1 ATP-dependent endonuclease [Erysipelothrix rhusiopathiae]MDE8088014.1 ATP-dependent endonuclease [Erysipelothrix rhusiopathiae]MDE8095255.1 ATP-dependent endonuclease [Erysipelothrix rhusiopathiae]
MRLDSIKIRNFRGYKDETKVSISDFTTFVGKNDSGKSTILEALEIFFNNKVVTCEREDLSINHDVGDEQIEITCIFLPVSNSISIDTTSETTLEDEFLLNKEGLLEIKKVFKATSAKPKPSTYIVCNHPSATNYCDLLTLKIAELRKRAIELFIDETNYDARSSVSLRRAIWETSDSLELNEIDLPIDREDSKKIYSKLEGYFPMYALFQSDRSSSDSDKEITDPMKIAVQTALKEVEEELQKIKDEVRVKALDTADKTLDKLREMNSELATSLTAEFKSEPNFDSLFKLTINSDNDIPMNKRGSGIRRLVLLNFFRAEAERQLSEGEGNRSIIYAFEEPETSQHPSHQRMLVGAFLDISKKNNAQVIITTHTPSICGLLPLDSLRLVDKEEDQTVVRCNSDDVYEKISENLGVLPEPFTRNAKALVLVEGKSDVIFLRHTAKKLKEGGFIDYTFEDKNIAIVPIGGCGNLKHWKTQKIAEQFCIPWAILLDSDKGTNDEERNLKQVEDLKNKGIKAYVTRKREPENYIDISCIRESTFDKPFSETENVKKKINQEINMSENDILEKLWPKMTVEKIRKVENYIDEQGNEKFEFTDMILDFYTMLD